MSSFDEAYAQVAKLVDDFAAHEEKFLSPHYNEAQVRKDFIDKFFIALGWDVDHLAQKNPYEQEVGPRKDRFSTAKKYS
jgi:adenine-specific DNA-methyltransferase